MAFDIGSDVYGTRHERQTGQSISLPGTRDDLPPQGRSTARASPLVSFCRRNWATRWGRNEELLAVSRQLLANDIRPPAPSPYALYLAYPHHRCAKTREGILRTYAFSRRFFTRTPTDGSPTSESAAAATPLNR